MTIRLMKPLNEAISFLCTPIFSELAIFKQRQECRVLLSFTGYMLLAGRCRNPSECKVIQEVIELHMKRNLDPDMLFGDASVQRHSTGISSLVAEVTTASLEGFKHIVWTHSMRRLAVLAGRALQFGEPILLVGETGYGSVALAALHMKFSLSYFNECFIGHYDVVWLNVKTVRIA